jgi:hypothetical protein
VALILALASAEARMAGGSIVGSAVRAALLLGLAMVMFRVAALN